MWCKYCGQKPLQGHTKGCPDEEVTNFAEWRRRLDDFERGREDAEVGLHPRSSKPAYRLGFYSTP